MVMKMKKLKIEKAKKSNDTVTRTIRISGETFDKISDLAEKNEISLKDIDFMPVIDVPRRKNNTPVSISANMELLVSKAISQNFVPVIDDSETFIGMVKRRTIVEYCYEKMKK